MYPNVTSIHAALDGLRAILVEDGVTAPQIADDPTSAAAT